MATRTLVALFADRTLAERAIHDLQAAGFKSSHIGIVMRDKGEAREVAQERGINAAAGAVTGSLIGGSAGALLAATGALVVPGIGPFISGGILATSLVGGTAGWLVGGLVGLGVPTEDAHYYQGRVEQGDVLVTVDPEGRDLAAESILRRNNGELRTGSADEGAAAAGTRADTPRGTRADDHADDHADDRVTMHDDTRHHADGETLDNAGYLGADAHTMAAHDDDLPAGENRDPRPSRDDVPSGDRRDGMSPRSGGMNPPTDSSGTLGQRPAVTPAFDQAASGSGPTHDRDAGDPPRAEDVAARYRSERQSGDGESDATLMRGNRGAASDISAGGTGRETPADMRTAPDDGGQFRFPRSGERYGQGPDVSTFADERPGARSRESTEGETPHEASDEMRDNLSSGAPGAASPRYASDEDLLDERDRRR